MHIIEPQVFLFCVGGFVYLVVCLVGFWFLVSPKLEPQ